MHDNQAAIERHKLAVAALNKNLSNASSVAESLLLGFQAIDSTHLLQKWFQDQVKSLESMLEQTGLDASLSESMPTDPFAALSQGETVQELTDTFHRALDRLEEINRKLKDWAEDFAREGERMESLRRDLQHKVLNAQGQVLSLVQTGSAPTTVKATQDRDAQAATKAVESTHPASAWAEAANINPTPTPGPFHGKTTPVRPDALTGQIEPEGQDQDAPPPMPKAEEREPTAGSPAAEDSPKRSPRVAIEVPVSVESATRLWFATSENCSETGVFVATPFVVPSGTRVTLELLFPGTGPMPVHGEVAWTRDAQNESGKSGMGVKLVDISEELETKLKQLLPSDQSTD